MRKLRYLILLVPFVLLGCKEFESLDSDIKNLTKLKSSISTEGPYSFEDQERLSDYFSGLNLLVKKIDDHPKGKKGLSKYLKKKGLVRLCNQILVSKPDWELIQNNCWKGEYFICSEDILEFEESIQRFADNLEGSNNRTFLTNEACAGAWRE